MYGLKFTEEAARIAAVALAADRKLDIVIERRYRDTLRVTLQKDGVAIFELEPIEVTVGNTITISGLQVHLNLEGGM